MSMFNWWSRKAYPSGDICKRMEKVGHDLRSIERRIRSMEQEQEQEQEQERKTKREEAERERLEKVKLEMLAEWEPFDGMAEARMRHDMRKRYEEATRAIRERDAERRRMERDQMIEEIATRVAAKLKEDGAKEAE